MTTYADLGLWALATLRATPLVVACVENANAILEAGDVTSERINAAQEARRENKRTHQVLAIVVQDLGEEDFVAQCAVFVYDRYGYSNIRAARVAIIDALVNQPARLAREALVNAVQFTSRSGHAIDVQFDLDIERIIFSGPLVVERDCYA